MAVCQKRNGGGKGESSSRPVWGDGSPSRFVVESGIEKACLGHNSLSDRKKNNDPITGRASPAKEQVELQQSP